MSNQASDTLFRLIKSLNKPEKRYFKVFSSRISGGEKSNYSILFDAIDKQKEYDEAVIMKRFRKEAFIKSFSITKSRLYDAILRSLDAYHANSSTEAQLKKLLHCVEILYKKALYHQSAKLLLSAKRIAEKYEKHTTLLEIFEWEKMLIEKDTYENTDEKALEKMLADDMRVLKKIEIFSNYWNVKSRLFFILNKRGKARSEKEISGFKNIIDSTLLKSDAKDRYFRTEYLYNHMYSVYYFGIGDYKNSYKYLNDNVEHIEKNVDKFKDEPNIYFSLLTNIIYIGIQSKKYKEAFEFLEKLRAMPEKLALTKNEDLDFRLFYSVYSTEQTIYYLMGEFEKGMDTIPIVEEGMKLYEGKLSNVRKSFMFFNSALICFGAEKYAQALRWTNRLLNDIDIKKSEDIYCFSQMLNLIIHFELGNDRMIPYAIKSTQRYLKTRNRVYKFETVFMNFINKMLKLDKKQQIQAYKELKPELEELKKDNFERTAFEYFDFLSWTESKISGKPFKEIMKAKAKK